MSYKEKIKKALFKDYINDDCKVALDIRSSLQSKKINKISKILKLKKYNLICYKNNSFIPLSANIGEGVTFPHGLIGIFISSGAIIGNNCTIFHQVTIGSNTLSDSKKKGAPIVGDNVYIGAGAKIIGNVKIGDNVRIGANCVVTSDIPDNATVVLEKNRLILHNEKRDNSFYKFNKNV